jgi:S1-C subfamily serine protease/Flp pilus assembly protein TadD
MRTLLSLLLLEISSLTVRADDAPAIHARLLKSSAWVRTTTQGVGTGWVADAERSWLVTNLHVVGEQDRVEAFFPAEDNGRLVAERLYYLENQKRLHESGRAVRGKVVLRQEASDLALVELETLPAGVVALPLADAVPGPGEAVHSCGNRHDAEALFLQRAGEVRQRGRLADGYFWRGRKLAAGAPCLIVSAPIHPGDSGGPLVNSHGKVVGVVSGSRGSAAAIAIQASGVRSFLAGARKEPPEKKAESSSATDLARQLSAATVWVRPSATEGRSAGWVVDVPRRLILTTSAGAGPSDLVDVVFPVFDKGDVVGEAGAYADRIGLRQKGQLVRGVVLARDPKRDLALVELESLPKHVAALGFAKKEPWPAEKVHALGHPPGVEFLWLYAAGAVRQAADVELQTSPLGEPVRPRTLLLQIPGGSTGGPVVNGAGELVGMLAAKEAPQQLGYAVAASELRTFLEAARPLFAPTTPEEHHARGQLLLTRGRYREAVAALEQAGAPAAADLSTALLRDSDVKTAVEKARAVVAASPDTSEARALLAVALLRAGKSDEARKLADEVVRADRKCATAHLVRGSLREGKEALADLDEALFLAPRFADAFRARAAVREKVGDDEAAIADLARAVEIEPNEPSTIRRRAVLYLKRNDPKRAVVDYERLVELQPREASAHRGLAGAWLAQGEETKALPALVAAVRWEPASRKDVLADVLAHGADLARRWPDDPEKRPRWYEQALTALRGTDAQNLLSGRKKDWDDKTWGDELERRIRGLRK